MLKSTLNGKNKVIAMFKHLGSVSADQVWSSYKMGKGRTENIGFNNKKGVDNEWYFPFKKRC